MRKRKILYIFMIIIMVCTYIIYSSESITKNVYADVNDRMNHDFDNYMKDIDLLDSNTLHTYCRGVVDLIELDGVFIKDEEYKYIFELKWTLVDVKSRQVVDSNKEEFVLKLKDIKKTVNKIVENGMHISDGELNSYLDQLHELKKISLEPFQN